MWAASPGFPTIADADVAKMSSASTGDDMSIFSAPPPPYSFMRAVDCDSCMVLTGNCGNRFNTILGVNFHVVLNNCSIILGISHCFQQSIIYPEPRICQ